MSVLAATDEAPGTRQRPADVAPVQRVTRAAADRRLGDSIGDGVPTWEDVARYRGRFLFDVAYRLTRNDDDAQDVVQEALLKVRSGLERYQPGSLEGWLARIVTNAFLDEMRRRTRRPVDALPDEPGSVLPASPAADEVCAGLGDDIQRALGDLPEDFRIPVVLCDVSDLSYAQIAVATGLPIGTVRSRIHRGRRMLRAALGSGLDRAVADHSSPARAA